MLRTRCFARQALTLILFCLASAASAHEMSPSISTISFPEDGARWRLAIERINLEALVARIGGEHDDTNESDNAEVYDMLRALPPEVLSDRFDAFAPTLIEGVSVTAGGARLPVEVEAVEIPAIGDVAEPRVSSLTLGGPVPAGAREVVFAWDSDFGGVVIRTELDENGEGYSAFLTGGDASDPIPVGGGATQDALSAFVDYVVVGFEHIVPLGLDHILFVVGLFLLSTQARPLLIQITSFTVAHTITLALGITGVINIPGSIVEPLIALSIVYVAAENMLSDKLQRWRPAVVVMFGLLHGLGFAGVLSEFGLAPGQFVVSLIAFNVGVELGQLAVIAICFLTVGLWFGRRDWYRDRIVLPGSLAIGGYSFGWFVERAFDLPLTVPELTVATALLGAVLLSFRGWTSRFAVNCYVLVCAVTLTILLSFAEQALSNNGF